MKRDMDTIRRIVLAVRSASGAVTFGDVVGIDQAEFAMHAQLLEEAGLVQASVAATAKRTATNAIIYRLTWQGQDFSDSIVDDTLWNKAKEHVLKPSASWTFGVLLDFLKIEIRRRIPGLDSLA